MLTLFIKTIEILKKILLLMLIIPILSLGNIDNYITSFAGDDQDEPKINQKDEEGKKQGKWVFLGKDEPEKGYPDDGKISEGTFIDDRKNGRWIIYYKDGVTPKVEGDFINNRPNGPFIKFNQNGTIREQGTFSKRRYIDSLVRFNEDGIKIYESVYNEAGKEAGKVVHYHDNGQVEFEYNADNDIPTGKAVRYYPNGDVKEEINYAADGSIESTSGTIEMKNPPVEVEEGTGGKPGPKPKGEIPNFECDSFNKVFNDDKELWMEGEFKGCGLYDGRLYIYDADGLLERVEVYKKGKYHSDGQL